MPKPIGKFVKFIFVCSLQLLLQMKVSQFRIMNNSNGIKTELQMIGALLQDTAFAEAMAIELDAACYNGIGETPPLFCCPKKPI
jgi:hypothetical protein